MPEDESKLEVSVGNVHVDQAIVAPMPLRKSTRQTLLELSPLLSVLITAAALITTSIIQVRQNNVATAQKIDSDWRAALEKLPADDRNALTGALEMQTFAGAKYDKQARWIQVALIPRISDPGQFDVAWFNMLATTDAENQWQMVAVAQSLKSRLYALYLRGIEDAQDRSLLPADSSFENFVLHPEIFPVAKDPAQLEQAQAEVWKLDSTTSALSKLWTSRSKQRGWGLTVPKADLSGMVFLNGDFTGVDFRSASMQEAVFLGACSVTPALLPSGTKVLCSRSSAK